MHVFAVLLLAFKAWMLLDAVKRSGGSCCSSYWFIICLVPFGDWAYFFLIKIHDPEFAKLRQRLLYRPPKLEEIRHRYNESPSDANKLLVAKALYDEECFEEALKLSREVVRRDAKDLDALYVAALAEKALGHLSEAQAALESLVAADLCFKDFAASFALVDVLWQMERRDEAIALLQQLTKKSNRLCCHTALAEKLLQCGKPDEAKELLGKVIDDFKYSPKHVRRMNRQSAREAKRLLAAL